MPVSEERSRKMKVVVLAGGTSSERPISIVSGTMVTKALREKGHEAVMVDVFCGLPQGEPYFPASYHVDEAAAYMHSFDDRIEELCKERRSFFGPEVLAICQEAEVVFMALHGSNGEDGKIQAAFDLLGIRYTGSNYLGSALAMDKETSKQLFRENHIPTPEGIVVRREEAITPPERNGVGLPCVVKPSCGGSSVGVSIARSPDEYEAALAEGFLYENVLIVEKYIPGREFSVGIVDGEVYPIIEIAPIQGFYDYHNKYQAGSTVETCPADLPEKLTRKMQNYALAAYQALRLDSYGRIDMLMDDQERMYCLEANTLPGMTPTSLLPQEAAAIGIDFPSLCEKLIEVSLRRKRG